MQDNPAKGKGVALSGLLQIPYIKNCLIHPTAKDLVFLRFYVFCMGLQKKENYGSSDYLDFLDECNAMLVRCGMAKLYPANRFENLLLLSLVSDNPFEMFESIIDASFINETGIEAENE